MLSDLLTLNIFDICPIASDEDSLTCIVADSSYSLIRCGGISLSSSQVA